MRRQLRSCRGLALLGALLGLTFPSSRASSQGCEPIRFTTPVNLGGDGQAYQPRGEWQLSLAYRRLVSNEWFIGSKDSSTVAPGGQSPVIRIQTVVVGVAYSINDRFRVQLSVPVSAGSFSRRWADSIVHEQKATGLGDVTVMGEAWILRPRTHRDGNVSVGLGLKAPTGSHTIASQYYTRRTAVDFPADQTIQPGDGGWAVILQSQAFRQLGDRTFGYAGASYMASPKQRTDVPLVPDSTTYWSVPDVYSARLGGAFSLLPDQGLTISLGGRIDGIPLRDLFGGGDDSTIKRTAYMIYADPGLSLTRGKGSFTLSVPYRMAVNRQKSLLERRTGGRNGGGFAKFLVFASYSHRL